MSLRDAWINLLYKAATGTTKTRNLLTPVGLIIFAVFTALFVIAAFLVDKVLGLAGILPETATRLLSLPLMAIGIGATAWSALHFLKVKGTPVPMNPPPKLVTTGPYRYARNPMLTGVFLLLFGIGFGIGSASLLFIFTPLYILANVWELKQIEEPELVKRLGEEYIEYRSKTPMFFPGLGSRSKPGRFLLT